MIESLLNLTLMIAVFLAFLGPGRVLLRVGGFEHKSVSEELVFSAGLGFASAIYILVALGFMGMLYPVVAWLLLGGGLATGLFWWVRWRPQSRRMVFPRPSPTPSVLWAVAAVLMAYVMVNVVTGLSPTLEGDSTGGYLLVAKEYAARHALEEVDFAYVTSYPQNGQMLSTLGFLLRGQILGQLLVSFAMGALFIGAMYAVGRAYFTRKAAFIGVAIVYGTYSVAYLHASGKIDLAWAAFDLLAIFAFSRWYFSESQSRHWRWLVLAGMFAGAAAGVKQATLFTVIALSLGIAFRLAQGQERRPIAWATAFVAFGLPISLAVLWVVRAYVMTGVIGSAGPGTGGEGATSGLLRNVWAMSMLGNAGGIEGPLGKPIGPALLAVVPLLVILPRMDRRIWHILALAAIFILLWSLGVQRARHLLPVLALLGLVAGYVIERLLDERRRVGQLVLGAVLVSIATNLSIWTCINLISFERVPYVVGLQDRDRYLEVNLPKVQRYPNYAILRYVWDNVAKDARFVALSTRNSFYLERALYARGKTSFDDVQDLPALLRRLEHERFTHLFVNNFIVEERDLADSVLLSPVFRDSHLSELICAEGQCLYALENVGPASVTREMQQVQ